MQYSLIEGWIHHVHFLSSRVRQKGQLCSYAVCMSPFHCLVGVTVPVERSTKCTPAVRLPSMHAMVVSLVAFKIHKKWRWQLGIQMMEKSLAARTAALPNWPLKHTPRAWPWMRTSIKAVLSDDEGVGQKAYRNPVCIILGCTGEVH